MCDISVPFFAHLRPSPTFSLFSSSYIFQLFRFYLQANGADVQERKGHPRPEKYFALGGWPLDTTNRYRLFDMDLDMYSHTQKFSQSFCSTPQLYRSRLFKSAINAVSAPLSNLPLTKSGLLDIFILKRIVC